MAVTILRSIAELTELPGPVALAIGVFDGVHFGHQAVIGAAKDHAAQHGGTAAVLTFDPHPARVLRPENAPRLLCSARHQMRILERFGVTHTVVCAFDAAFAATPAADFVRALAASCRPLGFISVGYSWRFGARGAGDIHLLMDAGEKLGFAVYGVPPVCIDGAVVSSTAIREAVGRGDFEKASRLLGRAYSVLGDVVRGRQLGRQIGVPTANVAVEAEQLPPPGVYAVRVRIDDAWRDGIANLGHRPTVTAHGSSLALEAHLFDFAGDLYGREIEVGFVRHLREERKFNGLDSLKDQIARDISAAREILRANGAQPR